MATYNDNLFTNFLVGQDQLSAKFQSLQTSANNFESKMSKVKSLDNLKSKLKDVNVKLLSNGAMYDRTKGKIVSHATAIDLLISKEKQLAKIKADKKDFLSLPGGMDEIQTFSNMGKQLGMFANQGINVNYQLDELRTRLAKFPNLMNALNSSFKKSKNMFDMNTLSWMFGGMMLRQMGMTIARFLLPSMDQLEKLQTEGAKKTMAVGAAFEFLKISLFETLSQTPLFQSFVEYLIKAAIWVSEFAQQNPALVEAAAIFAGMAISLGSIAIAVAGIKQLGQLSKLSSVFSFLASPFGATAAIFVIMGLATLSFEDTKSALKDIWDLTVGGLKEVGEAFEEIIGIDFEDMWRAMAEVSIKIFAGIGQGALAMAQIAVFAVTLIKEGFLASFKVINTLILTAQEAALDFIRVLNWTGFFDIDTSDLEKSIARTEELRDEIDELTSTTWTDFKDSMGEINTYQDKLSDIMENGLESKYLSKNLIDDYHLDKTTGIDNHTKSILEAAEAYEQLNTAIGRCEASNARYLATLNQQGNLANYGMSINPALTSSVTDNR